MLAVLVLGCGILTPDFERIIALEVETRALTLQVGDSDTLVARALNAAGDVVDSALISWAIVDVDSGQVGFTLDTTSGAVQALQAGEGRVQARVEDIRSQPILITVVADTAATPLAQVITSPHPYPFTGLERRNDVVPLPVTARIPGPRRDTPLERAATGFGRTNAAYRRSRPVLA